MSPSSLALESGTDAPFYPSMADRVAGVTLRGGSKVFRLWGGRGFARFISSIRLLHGAPGLMETALNSDSKFIFPIGDSYWSRFVMLNRSYESEIGWLLKRAKSLPYALLDCGANMGYWSILASSAEYGSHFAVGIEASESVFQILAANRAANSNRFLAVHRAIYSRSGETLRLYGVAHAGRSLDPTWHPEQVATFENVETISLDAAAEYLGEQRFPPLVKLDIEGAEIDALKGGEALLNSGAIFAYEDHGKDASNAVSRYLFSLSNVEVWMLADDGDPRRLRAAEELSKVKRNPISGYNFFAMTRSSPWTQLFRTKRQGQP